MVCVRIIIVVLAMLIGFSESAQAETQKLQQPQKPDTKASEVLQKFKEQAGNSWVVRWSKDGSRVKTLIGREAQPGKEKGAERARGFLSSNVALFGLKPDLSDLKVIREHTSTAGQHVELQQTYQELPVENGRIKVNLDREGRVLQVVSSYLPSINIPVEMTITEDDAKERAIDRFIIEYSKLPMGPKDQDQKKLKREDLKFEDPPKVERVVFLIDDKLRATMAYKVFIDAGQTGIMEFVVDGQTGDILRVRNFEQYSVDGQGRVFNPNPVQALNDTTLVDNNDAGTAVPAAAYEDVPLRALDDPVGGQHRLSGPYVTSEDITAPNTATVTEAGTTFNYDRGQDGFEEVMLYYHIDRSQRYIQTLGFIDANNRRIRVDAHGRTDENASYRPDPEGAGFLKMGDGGVDAGEDGDVILHEYGHSIQDNQNPGAYLYSGQAGAIGEGFSDYWALSNFRNESIAQGWDPACYSEWFWLHHSLNTAGTVCCRNADNPKVYPVDYDGGDFHKDGELWSGTLWDMLTDLGKTTADRLALQSNFNMPDNPSFDEAADAVMTADLQLFYGSHLDALCQLFINRGFYAAADCPQIPADTGGQDTLVVLARFNEAGLPDTPITAADVTTTINDLNNYLAAVSYGQVTMNHTTTGWHLLPGTRANYYDGTAANVLIDLVEDVIDVVAVDRPDIDFSIFDRLIIITNDDGSGAETRGQSDWATTGPWPYAVPAAFDTKLLSVSVHTFQHQEVQFTHALGHHFGMIDLYAHEGAVFPRPYADGWGNMADDGAGNFTNVHFTGWNKLKPQWLDDADVRFIQRPVVGASFNQIFALSRQSVDGAGRELIQVGITAGVNNRLDERVSYYVEARAQAADAYDANLPSDGVLVYYVNEDISQGFGPLRVVDATPGDNNLANAALQIVGDSINNIDGSGLNVELLAPTGTEDYRVRIDYHPPETEVDVWINGRDQNWRSVDIWVDSPSCNESVCGLDGDGNTREPIDRGDKPKPQQLNRLYARVYNHGPGIAHDVQVDFWVSDPYHGIDGGGVDPDTGGNVAFNKHFSKVIETLPVTDDGVVLWVPWTPEPVPAGQSNPHACVKVKIADVLHDINDFNQVSQENIHSYDTTSGSPYTPVVQPFHVANPYDHPILVYLRADNVPEGWTANIIPKKTYLGVGGSISAQIEIQAPEDYPVCSTEFVSVSAWYPSGDTLLSLGGTTAQVNLKQSVAINLETQLGPCNRNQPVTHVASESRAMVAVDDYDNCTVMDSKGCTDPPRPYEHITLEYAAPDGEIIYHDIMTDENGCFEDFWVNPTGGVWQVEATYPGDECHSTDTTGDHSVVVPPSGFFPGPCIPCIWLWAILIIFGLLILWLLWWWYRCCYLKRTAAAHG